MKDDRVLEKMMGTGTAEGDEEREKDASAV